MRKTVLITGAILCLLISCGQESGQGTPEASSAAGQESVGAVASKIAKNLESAQAHISKSEIGPGLNLLLDVTLLTRPEEKLPPGFKEKIESSREAYGRQDLAAGGERIAEALKLWRSDSGLPEKVRLVEPEGGHEPGPLAELFKTMIQDAEDKFKQGRANEGVSTILEALLLLGGPRRP